MGAGSDASAHFIVCLPLPASRLRRGERVEGGALFCANALSSSSLRPLRLDRSWGTGAADTNIDFVRHGRGRV